MLFKLVILLSLIYHQCLGYFNFFLDQSEVMKLMGLQAELYYVRQGEINEYAIKFVVPVPAQISKLHFTWQNLVGRPLPYEIEIEIEDSSALSGSLNITNKGEIPVGEQETWALAFHCAPSYDAEIDVMIRVNVSLTKKNATKFEFKRKKICLTNKTISEDGQQQEVLVSAAAAAAAAGTSAGGGQVFYVAIGCACAFVAAICVLVVAYYLQDKKTSGRHRDHLQESRRGLGSTCSTEKGTEVGLVGQTFSASNTPLPPSTTPLSTYQKLNERPSRELYEKIQEISVERVRLLSVEMEGTFGRIYKGSYQEEGAITPKDVLVKTTAEHASPSQVTVLLKEGLVFQSINHPSLLSIMAVSVKDNNGAPFLLYPYTGYKNMKRFLLGCKMSSSEGPPRALTTQEVMKMALQAARGVQYLHRKKLIHKDIAARNCVVDDDLRVQITDNALSRDLFPQDYYCLGDNENRPIKWLAIESLVNDSFSTASDVWAFGVLLWELTTLAQQPYVEVDPFEMASYLRNGFRLAQPINCPDELFAVMAYCWAMLPDERPTFSQLLVCLQDFHKQLTKYV